MTTYLRADMSKELLPELPETYRACEFAPDVRVYDAGQLRAYGQACYEAGRKSVDIQVLNDALRFVQWFTSGNGTPRDPVMVVRRASDITEEATALRDRLLAIIDGEK